jgi:hypothetical protein
MCRSVSLLTRQSVRVTSRPDDPVRFVVAWYRTVIVGGFGVGAVLTCSLVFRARDWPSVVVCVAGAAVIAAFAIRGWRTATIEFRGSEIRYLGLVTARSVALAEVRDIRVGRGSSAALLPWRIPVFEMADGTVECADNIRSLKQDSVVDAVITEARSRLDAFRSGSSDRAPDAP